MPYATLDHLTALCGERELIQLTDRAEPPSGQVDEDLVAEALVSASAEIDSYLAQAYTLPLGATPPFLKDICLDLARYRLYRDPTDEVKTRRKTAIEHLTNIAKGIAQIPGASGKAPAGRDDTVMTSGPGRRLSRDSMAGY